MSRMFKHLGTILLALFTIIMWSAALIGIASGWLARRHSKLAWLLGFVCAVVVFTLVWQAKGWLPIRSVWQPYERESDMVVILVLSVVAGCYAYASSVFWKSYGVARDE